MTARLVCGWGINDSPVGYIVSDCPFYRTWHDMLERRLNRYDSPSLRDVTVCEEWKFFWAFKQWMETKDWEGKDLDKDILIPGNKEYGPDACMFVTHQINSQGLRVGPEKPKSGKKYPQGVQLRRLKGPDKYFSQIVIDGKAIHPGTYSTVEAASSAYCKAKAKHLRELAEKQEPILKEALLRWADIYESA
ncbi:MAG: hypothetical protein ABGZ19_01440 [Verrucomicrobiales bacterium]